jgi:hypothetical protein
VRALFQEADAFLCRGGRRLAQRVRELLSERPHVTKISFLGVSLGGLYCRHAIGELFHEGVFASLELVNFVTIVSPATGVRTHIKGVIRFLVDSVGVIGATGPDLTLKHAGWPEEPRVEPSGEIYLDSCHKHVLPVVGTEAEACWRALQAPESSGDDTSDDDDEDVPLLIRMARVGSRWWLALRQFRNRVIVAVTQHDDKVPYEAAALASPHPDSLHAHAAEGSSKPALSFVEPSAFSVHPDPSPASYPHVTGVFVQPPLSSEGWDEVVRTQSAWLESFDHGHTPEGVMASCLRALGGWTTVNLEFSEFGAALMNHNRAANNSWLPWDSSGTDTVAFVAERCVMWS